jgi:hypothetical protein
MGIDLNLERSCLSVRSGLAVTRVSSKLNISSNKTFSSTLSSGIASKIEVDEGFCFNRVSISFNDIFGREKSPWG